MIVILLILTLNIVKSWQPLHTGSWNLNPWLIMTNHTFSYYFYQGQFLCWYKFFCNTAFIISDLQKDFHQDNLSFVCLQFYKHNCLKILASNICFHIEANNQ